MPDASPDWPPLHGDAFAGRRCLITGGAGFIGSHLVEALLQLGAAVVVLDDLSEGTETNLPGAPNLPGAGNAPGSEAPEAADGVDRLELIRGSITDPAALARAVDGCELVFHLAAKVSVPRSVADPTGYHAVNAAGTLAVLIAARDAGCRRVVYSASSSAYGDQPTLPKHEEMAPRPMSPYAASKLAAEHDCRAFAACFDIDTVSLRYFNIFGPRQKADSPYAGVIAAFARDLLAGRAPTIFGDGSATRDFTHVANAVHANLLAARHADPLDGEVLNIGTGRRISIAELATAMSRLAGREDLAPRHAPSRPGDVAHSQAEITRAGNLLDYRPIVDFNPGLEETWRWYAGRG